MAQRIIALLDGRTGNDKQTLALAEALGKPERIKIQFNFLAKLPYFILGLYWTGVKEKPLLALDENSVVISTGRKLARISATIKKEFGCKAINIMYPEKEIAPMFDFLITPEHDETPPLPNLIKVVGAVTAIGPLPIKEHKGENKNVAVLVGNITESEAQDLCGLLNINNANYMITTSRRTCAKALEVIGNNIQQPHDIYSFGSERPNPYYEYLDKADIIIATGDSVNMCTEASHTGKPLYIFETHTKNKFGKFWQKLYLLGCAKPLTGKLESWSYNPLNNLDIILKQISNLKR
jgi:hypothetical protein